MKTQKAVRRCNRALLLHCALQMLKLFVSWCYFSPAPLQKTPKIQSFFVIHCQLSLLSNLNKEHVRCGSSPLFIVKRPSAFLVHRSHTICPVQSRSAEPGKHQDGASLIRHSSAEQYMFEEDHIYISSGLFSIDPCMPNWPALGSGSRQH